MKEINPFEKPSKVIFGASRSHGGIVSRGLSGEPETDVEEICLSLYDDNANVMNNHMTRIPSHKNPANRFSTPKGYVMADIMLDKEHSGMLSIIAKEMGITGDFTCRGPRRNLKSSDLYFLHTMCTREQYRNRGYCRQFLNQISKQIRMLTRDPHPVIIASPYVYGYKFGKNEQVEAVTKMLLDAGFKPVRKNSKWYYIDK